MAAKSKSRKHTCRKESEKKAKKGSTARKEEYVYGAMVGKLKRRETRKK